MCWTATLGWGVNLPVRTVIIKGTSICLCQAQKILLVLVSWMFNRFVMLIRFDKNPLFVLVSMTNMLPQIFWSTVQTSQLLLLSLPKDRQGWHHLDLDFCYLCGRWEVCFWLLCQLAFFVFCFLELIVVCFQNKHIVLCWVCDCFCWIVVVFWFHNKKLRTKSSSSRRKATNCNMSCLKSMNQTSRTHCSLELGCTMLVCQKKTENLLRSSLCFFFAQIFTQQNQFGFSLFLFFCFAFVVEVWGAVCRSWDDGFGINNQLSLEEWTFLLTWCSSKNWALWWETPKVCWTSNRWHAPNDGSSWMSSGCQSYKTPFLLPKVQLVLTLVCVFFSLLSNLLSAKAWIFFCKAKEEAW